MMGTSWVFTAAGLTALMIPSVAFFTPTPSQPKSSSNVFNDTSNTQETFAITPALSSLATSTPYVIPTTSDAGSTVAREQATAHEDENSRLWLGVGLGAGAMAGVVLVLVLVMVVVLWARRWQLPCGQEETESPPAASPPAASLPAAAALPADGHNYEGLQSRSEGAQPGQMYEAIGDSTGNADVYENSDTVPRTPTARAPGGSKQSIKRGPMGNGGQEKKVEGGDMYVNYTPSQPPRPPRHGNLKHVQSASSPPPVPLSPPPRRPDPSVYTNADEGDPSDDDYVDMNAPAAASMTRKTKL